MSVETTFCPTSRVSEAGCAVPPDASSKALHLHLSRCAELHSRKHLFGTNSCQWNAQEDRAGVHRDTLKAWKFLPNFKKYSRLCPKFSVELWLPKAMLPRHLSREAVVNFALRKQIKSFH